MKEIVGILLAIIMINGAFGDFTKTEIKEKSSGEVVNIHQNNFQKESKKNTEVNELKEEMSIYIPDSNAEYLTAINQELIADPEELIKSLISTKEAYFVEGTELLGIKIEEGTAYVDLNNIFYETTRSDLIYNLNIMSIVHTLCLNESFEINEVIFYMEGSEKNIGIEQPLSINNQLINDR